MLSDYQLRVVARARGEDLPPLHRRGRRAVLKHTCADLQKVLGSIVGNSAGRVVDIQKLTNLAKYLDRA